MPPLARPLRLTAAAAGLSIVLASCLFVVPSGDDLSTTACDFQGASDTACGRCIRGACQNAVNACCVDSACSQTLDDLDACASSTSPGSCAALTAASASNAASSLGSCVTTSCSGACAGVPCTLDDVASSPCGSCMAASCGNELAECCGDPDGYCSAHIASARECAMTGSPEACARLSPSNPYVPDAGRDLNGCVASNCGTVCPLDLSYACSGKPKSSCISCCFDAFTKGHDDGFAIDTACACPPGVCAFECDLTRYCDATAPVPGDSCLMCLSREEGWGGGCHYAEQCYADLDCIEFTTCYAQCEGM